MKALEVRLHGDRIGSLTRERSGKVTFAFDQDWLHRPGRPVLSTAFEHEGAHLVKSLFVAGTGLPPYFQNLLPEGESRKAMAASFGVRATDEFALIEKGGRNLFGAVEVIGPESSNLGPTGAVEVGHEASSIEIDFLLAGMQRKLLLARAGERVTASTDEYIIKVPDFVHSGLVRNEYAMMRLARAAGFDVADVEMTTIRFPRNDPKFADMPETLDVLAVRRFDRLPDGSKVHAEEVNQMFGRMLPNNKYDPSTEAVAARLKDSGINPREVLRHAVFHAIIGNGDAHAKNFAVVYPDGRNARLAPMYDAVSTAVYGTDFTLALSVGGIRKWEEVNIQAFERFGAKLDIPAEDVRRIVDETIDSTLGAWHEVKEDFPDHLRDALENHFTRTLPLTRLHIDVHGFPKPLPRVPEHPDDTHSVKRTPLATVVRRVEDGKVDNPIDAAIVKRDGEEVHMRNGRRQDGPDLPASPAHRR